MAALSSPDDPPDFARRLKDLQSPDLTHREREEILWAIYDYFQPGDELLEIGP
jgi:hypothetical protein